MASGQTLPAQPQAGLKAIQVINENTPLLAVDDVTPSAGAPHPSAHAAADESEANGAGDTPLPRLQLFLLCSARWIEPVAFFSIIPYINQMCQENGNLGKEDVGFYSGLIESLFSLTQMLVMIFWGKASDRFGRKPILVLSLFGVSLCTALFGMATTLWEMILFRCMAGMFAGTIVTVRTMIAEISTPKTQPVAFSYFAFVGNLGLMAGPLLGGAFAEPAKQFPGLFKGIPFFVKYPYALPGLVICFISLVITVVLSFLVEETLPSRSKARNQAHGEGTTASDSGHMTTWELLKSPGVSIVLYTYNHIMLIAFGYTAVAPVFWYTPASLGGLEFNTLQISLFMALAGISQALWILVLFPLIQRRIGTTAVLRACAVAYPFSFLIMPPINILRRLGGQTAETAFWILAPTTLAVASGVSMSFTAIQLALNDSSPSPQMLGTLNSICLALSSGIRSFAPALFASLFAVGARTQWVGGHAIWLLFAGLAGGLTVVSRYLPDFDELRKQIAKRNTTEPAQLDEPCEPGEPRDS